MVRVTRNSCTWVLACSVLACGGLVAPPLARAQEPGPPTDSLAPAPRPDTIPSDTYLDEGARYMIQRGQQNFNILQGSFAAAG